MFAKSNLLVFDSSKVKETILENIQVMVEFGIFYRGGVKGTLKFKENSDGNQ